VLFLLCLLLFSGFDSLLNDGLQALNAKRFPVARTNLEAAAKLKPDSPRVWLALAQTYSKLGDKSLSADAVRKAEELAVGTPEILHGLALFYAEGGDVAKAAEYEEKYAVHDANATIPAIRLYLSSRKAERAVALGESAIAVADTAELRNLLGKSYEAAGNTTKAVPELRKAIEMNRYEEAYYFDLAQVLMIHQSFEPAIQVLESSRSVFAKSPQLELALGVSYYGQRRFNEAVDSFLRVIEMAPDVEQPYLFLGRIIDQAGERLPEVEKRFAGYAKANPKNAASQFLYAKAINASSGDAATVEALLRKSIALDDKNWESHLELGGVLDKRRAYDEAAKEFQRSIELNPKSSTPHYRLARVYERLGRKQEAEAERGRHAALVAEEEKAAGKQAAGMVRVQ
jgi:tetratricopeptide (TPR) repeat protein